MSYQFPVKHLQDTEPKTTNLFLKYIFETHAIVWRPSQLEAYYE